ncbi:hypothetical protein ACQR14_07640, partial [Bradyrhizobium oligotrophicum]|uniref:hypothetical protein n=1 Tax=Bradyrhizobium oligotrophicum TaxID=44255 RepID=UPI003EB973EF
RQEGVAEEEREVCCEEDGQEGVEDVEQEEYEEDYQEDGEEVAEEELISRPHGSRRAATNTECMIGLRARRSSP